MLASHVAPTVHRRPPIYKYFGFYVVVIGLLHLIFGGYAFFMKVAPQYLGVAAEATLVRKETKTYGRKLVKYFFEYRFADAHNREIEARKLIDKPVYLAKEEGDKFEVTYLPIYPEANYLQGATGAMVAYTVLAIGMIITIAGTIGLTMHLQRDRERAEESMELRT